MKPKGHADKSIAASQGFVDSPNLPSARPRVCERYAVEPSGGRRDPSEAELSWPTEREYHMRKLRNERTVSGSFVLRPLRRKRRAEMLQKPAVEMAGYPSLVFKRGKRQHGKDVPNNKRGSYPHTQSGAHTTVNRGSQQASRLTLTATTACGSGCSTFERYGVYMRRWGPQQQIREVRSGLKGMHWLVYIHKYRVYRERDTSVSSLIMGPQGMPLAVLIEPARTLIWAASGLNHRQAAAKGPSG